MKKRPKSFAVELRDSGKLPKIKIKKKKKPVLTQELSKSDKHKKLATRLEKASVSFKKVSQSLQVLVDDAVTSPINSNANAIVTNTLTSILATSTALIPLAERKYKKSKSSFDAYAYLAITDQVRDVAKELRQFREVEGQLQTIIHEIVIPAVQQYISESFKELKPLKEALQSLPESQRMEGEQALIQYARVMNMGLTTLMVKLKTDLSEALNGSK